MEFFHKRFEFFERGVAFIKPLSADNVSDRSDAGKNESGIVFCAFQQEICRFFIEMMRFHPSENGGAAHRGQNNAVFYFAISDFPGRKQAFVLAIHKMPP